MYFEKCLNAVPVSTGTTLVEQLAYIPPISTTMQHNGNESIPQIFARKVDFTTEKMWLKKTIKICFAIRICQFTSQWQKFYPLWSDWGFAQRLFRFKFNSKPSLHLNSNSIQCIEDSIKNWIIVKWIESKLELKLHLWVHVSADIQACCHNIIDSNR